VSRFVERAKESVDHSRADISQIDQYPVLQDILNQAISVKAFHRIGTSINGMSLDAGKRNTLTLPATCVMETHTCWTRIPVLRVTDWNGRDADSVLEVFGF
jgi:hypothetical protein